MYLFFSLQQVAVELFLVGGDGLMEVVSQFVEHEVEEGYYVEVLRVHLSKRTLARVRREGDGFVLLFE